VRTNTGADSAACVAGKACVLAGRVVGTPPGVPAVAGVAAAVAAEAATAVTATMAMETIVCRMENLM
jgi:hypothetical protein